MEMDLRMDRDLRAERGSQMGGADAGWGRAVRVAAATGVASAACMAWAHRSNWSIQRTDYELACPRLPGAFDGMRIVQISDLHNVEFGFQNETLLNRVRRAAPDAIFITGDLVDSRRTRVGVAVDFVAAASRIAPVYYVPGNHESRLDDYPQIETLFHREGATVLANGSACLSRLGERLFILGVLDPSFDRSHPHRAGALVMEDNLANVLRGAGLDGGEGAHAFTLLLAHRPELHRVYARLGIDVVFSGHAHGGQVRVPGVGGLFAPGQGVLPKVTEGVHVLGGTQLVVSRGLGPSVVPLRVHNRPELVVVDLRCGSSGSRS